MCGCVSCSRKILDQRCAYEFRHGRCGNYKGHGKGHTLLIATAFLIAEERVRLDA